MTQPTDSPALTEKADDYPSAWGGRVPRRIKMTKTVRPDVPGYGGPGCVATAGHQYDAFVNSHGAVDAILPSGAMLGLKPDEFVIMCWHNTFKPAKSKEQNANLHTWGMGQSRRVLAMMERPQPVLNVTAGEPVTCACGCHRIVQFIGAEPINGVERNGEFFRRECVK